MGDMDEDGNDYDDGMDEDMEDMDDEYINPDLLNEIYKAEEKLSVLMADVDKETLKVAGHQFEDMITECTFTGISCR